MAGFASMHKMEVDAVIAAADRDSADLDISQICCNLRSGPGKGEQEWGREGAVKRSFSCEFFGILERFQNSNIFGTNPRSKILAFQNQIWNFNQNSSTSILFYRRIIGGRRRITIGASEK